MIHLSEEFAFLNRAKIKLPLEHLSKNSPAMIDAYDSEYRDHDYWNSSLSLTRCRLRLKIPAVKQSGLRKYLIIPMKINFIPLINKSSFFYCQ